MRVLMRVVVAMLLLGSVAAVAVLQPRASGATVTPGVEPDFVLSPDQRQSKTVSTVLVNVVGLVEFHPDGCRDDPSVDIFCDAFRIKLHRSQDPEARNVVRVMLTWDPQATIPDLALVAAGLGIGQLPDLDLYAYATPDAPLGYDTTDDDSETEGCQGCEGVGGRGIVVPEILGFSAEQDEYDIVVQSGAGVMLEDYTMTVIYSDELFATPEELLDAALAPGGGGQGGGEASGFSGFGGESGFPGGEEGLSISPIPALAPIVPDADIAGIGLGVNEQFAPESLAIGGAARATASSTAAPSPVVLLVSLLVLPFAGAVGAVAWLRRRRSILV